MIRNTRYVLAGGGAGSGMLVSMIDRLAVAQALARSSRSQREGTDAVAPFLPVFAADGTRLGDPASLHLDWSALPREYLLAPGARETLNRTLDSLPPRLRTALLVDTEGLALADAAAGLREPIESVRLMLHRGRMILRQRLTDYFAAATAPH